MSLKFGKNESSNFLSPFSLSSNKMLSENSQVELSSNLLNITSNPSSHISESSVEVGGLKFSQEIEEILAKHLNQGSVIEKQVSQNYSHILEGVKKTTFYEGAKQKINEKRKIQTQNSLTGSTFVFSNKIFCLKCCQEVYTNVSYQFKDLSFWNSVGFFFESFKCCGEPRMMSRYQEVIHTCKNCGTIVARVNSC